MKIASFVRSILFTRATLTTYCRPYVRSITRNGFKAKKMNKVNSLLGSNPSLQSQKMIYKGGRNRSVNELKPIRNLRQMKSLFCYVQAMHVNRRILRINEWWHLTKTMKSWTDWTKCYQHKITIFDELNSIKDFLPIPHSYLWSRWKPNVGITENILQFSTQPCSLNKSNKFLYILKPISDYKKSYLTKFFSLHMDK